MLPLNLFRLLRLLLSLVLQYYEKSVISYRVPSPRLDSADWGWEALYGPRTYTGFRAGEKHQENSASG